MRPSSSTIKPAVPPPPGMLPLKGHSPKNRQAAGGGAPPCLILTDLLSPPPLTVTEPDRPEVELLALTVTVTVFPDLEVEIHHRLSLTLWLAVFVLIVKVLLPLLAGKPRLEREVDNLGGSTFASCFTRKVFDDAP